MELAAARQAVTHAVAASLEAAHAVSHTSGDTAAQPVSAAADSADDSRQGPAVGAGAGGAESGASAGADVAAVDSEGAPCARAAHWNASVKGGGSGGGGGGAGLVLEQLHAALRYCAGVSEVAVAGLAEVQAAGGGGGPVQAEAAQLQETIQARRQVRRLARDTYACGDAGGPGALRGRTRSMVPWQQRPFEFSVSDQLPVGSPVFQTCKYGVTGT